MTTGVGVGQGETCWGYDPKFFYPAKTQEAQLKHFVTQCEVMGVPCLEFLTRAPQLDKDYYLIIESLNDSWGMENAEEDGITPKMIVLALTIVITPKMTGTEAM
ncbi:hypothetical protein NPIL_676301 [Nephila pilipes]|uniref:Uncharacterized protein n=1 Tax=Nephila pilipes TaxID=299642 RepID=A0A8X6NYZ1_NEPPI|nr:hypothetical protein NPIL_676301 [Nephila pilipes]